MAHHPVPPSFTNPSPCASCPYRRDARLGHWDAREFLGLIESERSLMGSIYACHEDGKKAEKRICAGWLLDQRSRGYPSIRLRLHFAAHPEDVDHAEAITDGGHTLYESVMAMCQDNLRVILAMRQAAERKKGCRRGKKAAT